VCQRFYEQDHLGLKSDHNACGKNHKRKEVSAMKKKINWWKAAAVLLSVCVLVSGIGIIVDSGMAKESQKRALHKEAFAMYTKKCLGCHDSIADPEKPGRTRDDWVLVVNVMHGYGLDMTIEESGMIVDLLYDLRKGMEREAG
jgi:hypothetical protein